MAGHLCPSMECAMSGHRGMTDPAAQINWGFSYIKQVYSEDRSQLIDEAARVGEINAEIRAGLKSAAKHVYG